MVKPRKKSIDVTLPAAGAFKICVYESIFSDCFVSGILKYMIFLHKK
jgi:hypothetical protein